MKAPEPIWECDYSASRRKHHHRCRCCNRIIETGERAIMVRLSRGTYALHKTCGKEPHNGGPYTWQDAFAAWGTDRLIRLGYNIQHHPYSQLRSNDIIHPYSPLPVDAPSGQHISA